MKWNETREFENMRRVGYLKLKTLSKLGRSTQYVPPIMSSMPSDKSFQLVLLQFKQRYLRHICSIAILQEDRLVIVTSLCCLVASFSISSSISSRRRLTLSTLQVLQSVFLLIREWMMNELAQQTDSINVFLLTFEFSLFSWSSSHDCVATGCSVVSVLLRVPSVHSILMSHGSFTTGKTKISVKKCCSQPTTTCDG